MAGELNGTDVGIAIETGPGAFTDVGGVTTNSFTLNNGAIDITNKSSNSWRELLGGEGLQSVDITFEVVFKSSTSFTAVRTQALAKTLVGYQIARGAVTLTGDFYITSYAETAPDNDKVTASISMQSSGAVTGI